MLQREINPVDGEAFRLSFKGRKKPMLTDAPFPIPAAAFGAGVGVRAEMMMMTMTITTRMRGGSG